MSTASSPKTEQTGGCYCGAVRYVLSAPPLLQAQCHCRPCQHIAGGGPQYFMLVAPDCLTWTGRPPTTFRRPDLPEAVTRSFCALCGTHILTQRQDQTALVLKVGTLDDPSFFAPTAAICFDEAQPFHTVAAGVPTFDGIPRRG